MIKSLIAATAVATALFGTAAAGDEKELTYPMK